MGSNDDGGIPETDSDNGSAAIASSAEPAKRLNVSFCIITHKPDSDNLKRLVSTLPGGAEVVIVETVPTDEELPPMGRVWGQIQDAVKKTGNEGDLTMATWRYKRGEFCFATARNVSISLATRDWIFWLDSDDLLPQFDVHILYHLDELPRGIVGLKCGCAGFQPAFRQDGQATYYNTPHLRIFRNQPELRFTGRVHEQIIPLIAAAKGTILDTRIIIIHTGYCPGNAAIKEKLKRNVDLLYKHLAHPDGEDKAFYQKILQNHLGTLDEIQAAEMPVFVSI